jgi:hypothetical protein
MCETVFVPPLAVGKLRNGSLLLTPMRHANAGKTLFAQFTKVRAFIAAFTSKKRWMTIQKSLFRNWLLILNIFSVHFLVLLRCKTKGAVGAV